MSVPMNVSERKSERKSEKQREAPTMEQVREALVDVDEEMLTAELQRLVMIHEAPETRRILLSLLRSNLPRYIKKLLEQGHVYDPPPLPVHILQRLLQLYMDQRGLDVRVDLVHRESPNDCWYLRKTPTSETISMSQKYIRAMLGRIAKSVKGEEGLVRVDQELLPPTAGAVKEQMSGLEVPEKIKTMPQEDQQWRREGESTLYAFFRSLQHFQRELQH